MKRMNSIENGKKGGRPESCNYKETITIPGIYMVILTRSQYDTLLVRYGKNLLECALLILDNWLKTSPLAGKYKGRNNYAHFRSDGWIIHEARQLIK